MIVGPHAAELLYDDPGGNFAIKTLALGSRPSAISILNSWCMG